MTDSKASEQPSFWETTALADMSQQQWESLCDSCGKCCLHKLEDEDSGEILYTSVICQYLQQDSCQCSVYANRQKYLPDCVVLKPDNLADLHWMPDTCAYRLLYEGKSLPAWHPLLTGNRQLMAESGNSITGKVISDEHVHEDGLEEFIIRWVQ